MSQVSDLKPLLKNFFIIGLAPYVDVDQNDIKINTKSKMRKFVYSIPLLLSIVINSILFLKFLLHAKAARGSINFITYFICVSITMVSNYVALWQCYRYKFIYFEVIQNLMKIERIFHDKIIKKISLKDILKQYWMLVIVVQILNSLTLIKNNIQYIYGDPKFGTSHLVTAYLDIIPEIISCFTMLHPCLYLKIVQLYLRELNFVIIANSPSKTRGNSKHQNRAKTEFLNTIKSVHFELWQLIQKINIYFGWTTLSWVVKFLADSTYLCNWFFVDVHTSGWQTTTYISKINPILFLYE